MTDFQEDDKLLVRHVLDLCSQRERSYSPRFSAFLDERSLGICESALRSAKEQYITDGGYPDAKRRVIVLLPDGMEDYTAPFSPVVFNYREQDAPTHRDFLGSLMSLEIKRELLGDILVGKTRTVVFVSNRVLPLIENITKIGRVGVNVSFDFCEEDIPEQKFEEIHSTVASLRLDAIVSTAFRISREKSQDLIKAKGVLLNHAETFDISKKIDEGDSFSIRGFGKACLSEIGGQSKKDRIFITIKKYI